MKLKLESLFIVSVLTMTFLFIGHIALETADFQQGLTNHIQSRGLK